MLETGSCTTAAGSEIIKTLIVQFSYKRLNRILTYCNWNENQKRIAVETYCGN